ncbi:hypothetical protein IV203_023923 [Nitzschia inconspicua]|uniref:Uncharacterized protein n=1 Tax=Nitzschia inconspicua TaxID=303405 RepID=A0A9K3KBX8_9STRA|nr:hypothetical protein IV203_023923 [Nitzschia inconspicua]
MSGCPEEDMDFTEEEADMGEPQRRTSTAIDPDTKALEEAEYDASFKAAIAQNVKDEAAYKEKMGKVIAVLWSQCTREFQIKIEEQADYKTHIKDDAIALMNAIAEHAMGYGKSKFKLEIVGDAIRNLFMIRHEEEEELI